MEQAGQGGIGSELRRETQGDASFLEVDGQGHRPGVAQKGQDRITHDAGQRRHRGPLFFGDQDVVIQLEAQALGDQRLQDGRDRFNVDEQGDVRLPNSVVAQLLFLEADDVERDVIMYINSPGGYVSAELSIFDTMNYIKPDVSTICMGQAASAAACILASGVKGKRYALKNARIMLHQVSSGASGHIDDMKIEYEEAKFLNDLMLEELARITGHSKKKIKRDIDRNKYMSAEEAKEYGIIDEVLTSRS